MGLNQIFIRNTCQKITEFGSIPCRQQMLNAQNSQVPSDNGYIMWQIILILLFLFSPPPPQPLGKPPRLERKPSLRNRLKGAFSFQNLRKAISSEKIDEEERLK